METIFKRRSIRKYTSEALADEDIKKLLKAGMAAPSAMNEQPWQFVVINKRELLDQIPNFHAHASLLKGAPTAILVAADKNCSEVEEEETAVKYMTLDCAAATQNILLAAESKGLGAVWIGIYPRKERMKKISELLKLPEDIVPVSLIAVGHPAEEKSPIDRYLEDRVHYNQF